MKVFINASSARLGGGQTYLMNLLRFLPEPGKAEVFIVAPTTLRLPPERADIRLIHTGWPLNNPLLRAIWEMFCLPGLLRRLKIDVLFCPGGVVWTQVPPHCRVVTMFRNMIPFDTLQRSRYPLGYMRMRNWILEKVLLRSMARADLLIYISKYAKTVIDRRAPGAVRNSVVIPHGVSPHFRADPERPLRRPGWLPAAPYFLYVSTLDFYKAQIEVVRGFAIFKRQRGGDEKLVLAGPENPVYARKVREEVADLGLAGEVVVAGMIPYQELPSVYQHALINIFASESENCPNILLEALATGRPILCSSFPPMPEFGGEAVIYFDPRSPDDFAQKASSLVSSNESMDNLSKQALQHSLVYDWDQAARQTWNAILELLPQPSQRLIIHAPNVHQGGGQSLLQALLAPAVNHYECVAILDERFDIESGAAACSSVIRVAPTIRARLKAERQLKAIAQPSDIVLCFGNLPPLLNINGKVVLFIQNRYLTAPASLAGFTLRKRAQIVVERLWIRSRLRGVDQIIVQTPSMQKEIARVLGKTAVVLPFVENRSGYWRETVAGVSIDGRDWDFLYVASGEPHKNHRKLIEAWRLLALEGIFPSLVLTVSVESFPDLHAWICAQSQQHGLRITNVSPASKREMAALYHRAQALIYPSDLESLGLPLIEARCAGLPVLAAELDYVRDVIDPEQTFDPDSPVSIARAVKRFLGRPERALPLLNADEFIRSMLTAR